MNHDYAHCSDYKKDICPKECFRGELVRDLAFYPTLRLIVSWQSFKNTEECLLDKEQEDENDN